MGWVSPAAQAHAHALAAVQSPPDRLANPSALTLADFEQLSFRDKVRLQQQHPSDYERLLAQMMHHRQTLPA